MKYFLLLFLLTGCATRLPLPGVNLSPIQEPILEAQSSTKEIKTLLQNWNKFSVTSIVAQVSAKVLVTESNLLAAREQTLLKQKELNDYAVRVDQLSKENGRLLLASRLQLKWLTILGIGLLFETVGIFAYLIWKLK